MVIREKLTEYGKKNIPLDDLASIMRISVFETESLYRGIVKLIDMHMIVPVKASDTNGNKNYEGNERIEHGYYKIMNSQMSLF